MPLAPLFTSLWLLQLASCGLRLQPPSLQSTGRPGDWSGLPRRREGRSLPETGKVLWLEASDFQPVPRTRKSRAYSPRGKAADSPGSGAGVPVSSSLLLTHVGPGLNSRSASPEVQGFPSSFSGFRFPQRALMGLILLGAQCWHFLHRSCVLALALLTPNVHIRLLVCALGQPGWTRPARG